MQARGVGWFLCGIADFGTSIAVQIIDGWMDGTAHPSSLKPMPWPMDGMDKPPLPLLLSSGGSPSGLRHVGGEPSRLWSVLSVPAGV